MVDSINHSLQIVITVKRKEGHKYSLFAEKTERV